MDAGREIPAASWERFRCAVLMTITASQSLVSVLCRLVVRIRTAQNRFQSRRVANSAGILIPTAASQCRERAMAREIPGTSAFSRRDVLSVNS